MSEELCEIGSIEEVLECVGIAIPLQVVLGNDCGVLCDFCPLRPWKSQSLSVVYCQDIRERLLEEVNATLVVDRASHG